MRAVSFVTVSCASLVLAACHTDGPIAPDRPEDPSLPAPDDLAGRAFRLNIDLATGRITVAAPGASVASTRGRPAVVATSAGSSLAFSLLGSDAVSLHATNCVFTPEAGRPNKLRCTFRLALTNLLDAVDLVTPTTFPRPPQGTHGVLVIPYAAAALGVPGGSAVPTDDWNGPRINFFNDFGACPDTPRSDCYRSEVYPSPLVPGQTTAAKRVGFVVDRTAQSVAVYVVMAADLRNAAPQSTSTQITQDVPEPSTPGQPVTVSVQVAVTGGGSGIPTGIVDVSGAGSACVVTLTNGQGSCVLNPTSTGDLLASYHGDARFAPSVSAPEPHHVTPPAPAGKIALVSTREGNSEIYVMNPDGSGPTRLTTDPAADLDPAWSPDGSKIAFWSTRDFNQEIYVMNADGSGQTRLTTDVADDLKPAWSPDGSKIAFRSNRDGNYEIYVMNADGSGQTRLTTDPASDLEPTWSPDGSKIAFSTGRDFNQEIYVMNADGSGPTRLTTDPAFDSDPAWSPDGAKIAFLSNRDGGNWEIYVMNADGSGQTRLTTTPLLTPATQTHEPAWSPDGSKITFSSNWEGNYEIYVMDADGSGQTRLTTDPAIDSDPDWGTG